MKGRRRIQADEALEGSMIPRFLVCFGAGIQVGQTSIPSSNPGGACKFSNRNARGASTVLIFLTSRIRRLARHWWSPVPQFQQDRKISGKAHESAIRHAQEHILLCSTLVRRAI
jgi:hypothetical protein